jgi:GNAT superfamily N-acetyltransferase
MSACSRIRTRPLATADVAALLPLLQAYMRETYGSGWNGSAEALCRDALGQKCAVQVALAPDGSLTGFLAWTSSYDLHHCVPGAEGLDLYVVPGWRGWGIALLLVCAAAAEIARGGGVYLKGTTVESGSGGRMYSRFAVCDAAGCIIGGRAFRRMAELAGLPVREVFRSLPHHSWNYEP